MAFITLDQLNAIIEDAGSPYIGTPMAVAYLNFLMEPLVPYMRLLATPRQTFGHPDGVGNEAIVPAGADEGTAPPELATPNGINEWTVRDLLRSSMLALEIVTADGMIEGAIRTLLRKIVDDLPTAGYSTTSGEFEYENFTLTPWEIVEAISDGAGGLPDFFGTQVQHPPFRLPVSVRVHGNTFTHELTMDLAMGMLLLAQTARVNLEMTIYGEPLTYFIEGQDDLYLRYGDEATEDESNIRMVGSPRRYYFFGTDFLQGIKTAAEWLGLDHHDYWDSFQDGDGTPLTF